MHVDARDGTIEIRLDEGFEDLEGIVGILKSAVPFSELIVDFTGAYDFPDRSFPSFVAAIKQASGSGPCVSLRGLTPHQSRLLRYLGLLRS